MVAYADRRVVDYQALLGKPVIRGTRLMVESLLRKLVPVALRSTGRRYSRS